MSRIRELRKKCGLTQAELGNILGVKRSTVALWERGTNNPRFEMLPKLARALRCKVDDFYIASCCTTTPTADGGTDYDSGSTTYGNPDSLVKMMSFIICDIETREKIPAPATIVAIMETVKQMKRGAGYNVRQ